MSSTPLSDETAARKRWGDAYPCEIHAANLCGETYLGQFLSCEVLVNGDFSWNRSYFVLAGGGKEGACVLRYLSPGDVSPRAQLHVERLRVDIMDDVVMINEDATKTFWFLRSDSAEGTMEWGAALKRAQAGDLSAFSEKVELVRKATRLSSAAGSVGGSGSAKRESLGSSASPSSPRLTSHDYADARPLPLFLGRTEGGVLVRSAGSNPSIPGGTTIMSEFAFLFRSKKDRIVNKKQLAGLLLTGGLWNSNLRSVCWKVLLGALPSSLDKWASFALESRSAYKHLSDIHLVGARKVAEHIARDMAASGNDGDLRDQSLLDALNSSKDEVKRPRARPAGAHRSAATSSTSSVVGARDWKDFDAIGVAERSKRSVSDSVRQAAEIDFDPDSLGIDQMARQPSAEISEASAGAMLQYGRHMRVKAIIAKDLDRTQVSNAYFHSAHVRETMSRILLTWALSNPDIGYQQGMNEILAIVLLVLHTDCESQTDVRSGESFDAALRSAVSAEYIESDAYDLFSRIMERMCSVFSPSSRPSTPPPAVDSGEGDLGGKSLVDRLSQVQHVLLQRTDPVLAAKLHALSVDPDMYLVRWVKVMLTREYGTSELLLLWDAIFAATPSDFALLESICVEMIRHPSIRPFLMSASDSTDVLRILKSYPKLKEDEVCALVRDSAKTWRKHLI